MPVKYPSMLKKPPISASVIHPSKSGPKGSLLSAAYKVDTNPVDPERQKLFFKFVKNLKRLGRGD